MQQITHPTLHGGQALSPQASVLLLMEDERQRIDNAFSYFISSTDYQGQKKKKNVHNVLLRDSIISTKSSV